MFEVDLWNVNSLSSAMVFGSGTALISESAGIASAVRKGHLCASKVQQSFFCKRPVAVYIANGGRRKVNRKGTSPGRIS